MKTLGLLGLLSLLSSCSGAAKSSSSSVASLNVTRPLVGLAMPTPHLTFEPWRLQDLSILFPLPATLADPHALKNTTSGARGVLIPAFASDALPLLESTLNQSQQASRLQVVGVRVDLGEIHLVWQIFENSAVSGTLKVSALDTAVHTFYKIDDQSTFYNELRALAQLSRNEVGTADPLGVHPTLQKQGWDSDYGRALNAIILKWAGEKNLFKITFTAVPQLARWFFGGFMIQNGQTLPLEIPRVNTNGTQLFVNGSSNINVLGGITSPAAPAGQDEFNRILADSLAYPKEPQGLQAAHFTAVTLENPRLGNPQTLDCASCHMAQMVKDWTEDKQDTLHADTRNVFTSSGYNLTRQSADRINTENVRAFGYFLSNPTITQRAINDTAYTAEQLNSANLAR